MAGRVGRAVTFEWEEATIPGVQEKGVSCNGEPIDVTSDENAGWRTLLTVAGVNQVNVSLSGVTKSTVLRSAWHSGNRTGTVELGYPDGSTVAGEFYIASYNESEPVGGAATFDCELQSTGAVVYTAGAAPTNTVLPAIAGTPQVGQTLVAFPGVWTGAPSFTYQWNVDGSPVSGQTGKTYVPVVGDIGDAVTVTVTGTNTAGSDDATSADTADVIAA